MGPELSKFMQNVDFWCRENAYKKDRDPSILQSGPKGPGAPEALGAPEGLGAPQALAILVSTLVDFPFIFPYFPFFSIYGFWQPGAP